MLRVIFACVHNAGRSQMAAALFNAMADPSRATAISAGTQPADRVHPEVVAAMQEAGIDISTNRPQLLTEALVRDAALVVTMGCGDACPYVPGVETADWPVPDPKGRAIAEVRRLRDGIRDRVSRLIEAHGWRRTTTSV